ncbi:hypothetical protein [Amycolatopsis sp. FDAARGOS 1241]|uniref:hypothetical protein n=1 Tax=Amycolatopsis sp. FDAARGOS 1241 TaxID=2778070 RepID=UPI001950E9F5|nr:hypothetical protein [Amycolatopsis sp. FDAARGOS 1241]QRP44871.1 hypothetical protein I6J71_37535 [Amycolatopsis sp. FDAARGOS 1241]
MSLRRSVTVALAAPVLLVAAAVPATASLAPIPPSPLRCAAVGQVAQALDTRVEAIVAGMGTNPDATANPVATAFDDATAGLPAPPATGCSADSAAAGAVVHSIFTYVRAVNRFAPTLTPTVSLVVDPSVSNFVYAVQSASPGTYTATSHAISPEMRGELLRGKYVLTVTALGF